MDYLPVLSCRSPGCGRQVAWTYSGINDHLKSHSLSMAEYELKYHKPEPEEDMSQVGTVLVPTRHPTYRCSQRGGSGTGTA